MKTWSANVYGSDVTAEVTGRGVHVRDVNENIVCCVCFGYLIDATTITECLHSCKKATLFVRVLSLSVNELQFVTFIGLHCVYKDVALHQGRNYVARGKTGLPRLLLDQNIAS